MFKQLFSAMASSSRILFRNWRALIILVLLNVAMIGAGYRFFVTREATIIQLVLTLLLALLASALFFLLQAMALGLKTPNQRLLALLGGSLSNFWKLVVISLPLVLVAVLAAYVLGRIEAPGVDQAVNAALPRPGSQKPTPPLEWYAVALRALRYILFGVVFPLAAIHLWMATERDGLKRAFKLSAHTLARAFAPQAVVTYAIGLVFFAVIPYFLIVTKTSATSAWLDVALLGSRLVLAVVFSLIGWVVTVGALGRLAVEGGRQSVAQAGESAGHVPAEA